MATLQCLPLNPCTPSDSFSNPVDRYCRATTKRFYIKYHFVTERTGHPLDFEETTIKRIGRISEVKDKNENHQRTPRPVCVVIE